MEQDPRNLSTLVTLLTEQVSETDEKIASLTSSAKKLVSPEVYEELSKDKPPQINAKLDEKALIEELEKSRLELITSLQQQDFIGVKLQEMIVDSHLLVATVVDHCNSRERMTESEEANFEERCDAYKTSLEEYTMKDLDDNLQHSATALKYIQSESLRELRSLSTNQAKLLSKEYKTQLDKMIDTLNTTFESLVKP